MLFHNLFLLLLPLSTVGYDYIRHPVPATLRAPCPGVFCGRNALNDSWYGECGRCDRGSRVTNNTHSLCEKCTDPPTVYDCMYFLFMGAFPLVLNWAAIDYTARRRYFTKEVLVLHLCALLEITGAALITLLVNAPVGHLGLITCKVHRLSDWYSILHNPHPNYEETLYCGQEAVYPRYTMVFMFYAFAVALMLLLRPLLSSKFLPGRGRKAIYAALYFYPTLGFFHAVLGGVIYFSFPYIVLILSLASSAAHFSFKLDQSARALLLGCVTDSRNAVIVVGHWLLHAFGIMAITQLTEPTIHLSLLALVPVPALFYISTARFTDPNNFQSDMST